MWGMLYALQFSRLVIGGRNYKICIHSSNMASQEKRSFVVYRMMMMMMMMMLILLAIFRGVDGLQLSPRGPDSKYLNHSLNNC